MDAIARTCQLKVGVMRVSVSVIDSMHGRPAEGVGVAITGQPADMNDDAARARTDENGRFEFSGSRRGKNASKTYSLQLDIDTYFAAMGIVSFHERATLDFRVLNPDDDCRLVVFITPSLLVTYCASGL